MARVLGGLMAAFFLCGCTLPPKDYSDLTPATCRAYGVSVADGAARSGTIVARHYGTLGSMLAHCGGSYWRVVGGCTRPVGAGRYEIYYADRFCIQIHEACHAIYETPRHTGRFLREIRDDWLAACPRGETPPGPSRRPDECLPE